MQHKQIELITVLQLNYNILLSYLTVKHNKEPLESLVYMSKIFNKTCSSITSEPQVIYINYTPAYVGGQTHTFRQKYIGICITVVQHNTTTQDTNRK